MRKCNSSDRILNRNALRRIKKARDFPNNTCPASRHVQIIAECLAAGKPYAMIEEEPGHVAGSLLSVVESLFKARTELNRLGGKWC